MRVWEEGQGRHRRVIAGPPPPVAGLAGGWAGPGAWKHGGGSGGGGGGGTWVGLEAVDGRDPGRGRRRLPPLEGEVVPEAPPGVRVIPAPAAAPARAGVGRRRGAAAGPDRGQRLGRVCGVVDWRGQGLDEVVRLWGRAADQRHEVRGGAAAPLEAQRDGGAERARHETLRRAAARRCDSLAGFRVPKVTTSKYGRAGLVCALTITSSFWS